MNRYRGVPGAVVGKANRSVMNFLSGAKTYIVAVLLIAIGILHKFGWIDADMRNLAVTVLVGGGLATLRMAVAKVDRLR